MRVRIGVERGDVRTRGGGRDMRGGLGAHCEGEHTQRCAEVIGWNEMSPGDEGYARDRGYPSCNDRSWRSDLRLLSRWR